MISLQISSISFKSRAYESVLISIAVHAILNVKEISNSEPKRSGKQTDTLVIPALMGGGRTLRWVALTGLGSMIVEADNGVSQK